MAMLGRKSKSGGRRARGRARPPVNVPEWPPQWDEYKREIPGQENHALFTDIPGTDEEQAFYDALYVTHKYTDPRQVLINIYNLLVVNAMGEEPPLDSWQNSEQLAEWMAWLLMNKPDKTRGRKQTHFTHTYI